MNHRSVLLPIASSLGICVSGFLSVPICALEATGESSSNLEEVVVTAQRRAERLQDVPISVANMDADLLTQAHIQDLAGIAKLAPAVRFDKQGPFTQVTIRGVGSAVVTSGTGPNVGIYIDGFLVPNAEAADIKLFSIESIEVLKGPQGTLFGRNTTGGAILVNTVKPSQETNGIADVSYGSRNSQRYTGYFTTGILDHVAVDVAIVEKRGDGYFTNIATHNHKEGAYDDWNVRTGLKVDFSESISVLLRYEHQAINDPTSQEASVYVLNGQPITEQAVIPGAIVATRPGDVSNSCIPRCVGFVANNDIVQLTPTFDLGFGTLTSYTQFRHEPGTFYQAGIPGSLPLLGVKAPVTDDTISQEFLVTSKPGTRLQWTAGAYYFKYTDLFENNTSINGTPYSQIGGAHTDTESYAGFTDVTYQAAAKLFLTAGVRYTDDEVKDAYYLKPRAFTRVYAPTLMGNKVTPRAVLRYTPNENSSIYASFSQGYKAGIFNLLGNSLVPAKPETISAYEAGFKYAAHALAFDLASYYYKYNNLQVSSYGVGPGNVPITIISNAANSRIYGFEGEVHYELVSDLDVNASAAYLHARYISFPNAPANVPCFTSPTSCGANYGMAPPVIINARGFEMLRAPEWTSSVGVRYSTGVARGRLALSSNLYYTSKFYEDLADQLAQSAYATLGLHAQWSDPSGRLTLAVYGDNLTGRKYYSSARSGSTGFPVVWAPPAMVFGEISYRFR